MFLLFVFTQLYSSDLAAYRLRELVEEFDDSRVLVRRGVRLDIVLDFLFERVVAGLALAKIPWAKWAKWILPLIGLQYLLGAVFVVVAQVIGLQ